MIQKKGKMEGGLVLETLLFQADLALLERMKGRYLKGGSEQTGGAFLRKKILSASLRTTTTLGKDIVRG